MPVVRGMMRSSALTFATVLTCAACARPVLYYPTPESVPAAKPTRSESPPAKSSTTKPRPKPAPTSSDDSPLLMTIARTDAGSTIDYLRSREMLLPVAGASMRNVEDTFNEPRDGGERVHRAIDILAERGTPILSADDGRVVRMTTSNLGGISMFTVDREARIVYYYAHMERYHPSMAEGRALSKGDTIGFVGTTGNAPKNVPHLHFQVMRMPADGRYWDGEPINPYPLLRELEADRGKGGPTSR